MVFLVYIVVKVVHFLAELLQSQVKIRLLHASQNRRSVFF